VNVTSRDIVDAHYAGHLLCDGLPERGGVPQPGLDSQDGTSSARVNGNPYNDRTWRYRQGDVLRCDPIASFDGDRLLETVLESTKKRCPVCQQGVVHVPHRQCQGHARGGGRIPAELAGGLRRGCHRLQHGQVRCRVCLCSGCQQTACPGRSARGGGSPGVMNSVAAPPSIHFKGEVAALAVHKALALLLDGVESDLNFRHT